MNTLKNNLYFKIVAIVVITLFLLVPAAMIKGLIRERENTQKEAIREVSSKWGGEQFITGPFLTIPYNIYLKQTSKTGDADKIVKIKRYIHILPTELKITGTIKPERRYRGIYEIVVYNSSLKVTGSFRNLSLSGRDIPLKDILFDKATLSLGITDLRGIEKPVALKWNDKGYSFHPGTPTNDVVSSGINTHVVIENADSATYRFSLHLDLKGSQKLFFVPVGEMSDITLVSNWSNPSFNGAFLPDTRTVSAAGFKANWNVLNLNRNFPQEWTGRMPGIKKSAFGVDLLVPVGNYQKAMRSIKYALLFIAFTFVVFFFVEVLKKVNIHPVQYILVGSALVIFYTLLLSLSEYLSFNGAFILSAFATLLLIFGYVKAILKSTGLALLIGGILAALYTFIFVIIQLQDYALLIGSVGIFVILGLAMYLSREMDWYNLNMGEKQDDGSAH